MKVLWFTDNPCSSPERGGKGTVTGGWHGSLEKAVRDSVELSIGYLSSERVCEEFVHNGVHYYSINPFSSPSYLVFRAKRLFMGQRRRDGRTLRRMREIIARCSPDIIHVHGTERCFGLICQAQETGGFSGGRQIPVVISIQGLMNAIVGKFFSGIGREEIARHESLGSKLKKQSILRLYREFVQRAETERRILRSARYILGRTRWDKETVARMCPDMEYFTVGEIMREPFFRMKWTPKPPGGVVRIASTLSTGPYKGYETLLRTADLLKQNARIRFEWTIIGYDSTNEYALICEKSTGLSASECGIRFAGRQDAEHVAQILCGADIFCQTSHIENSPNSLCEAMLLGLPSVATDVGGTSSILRDGEDGLLVPDGNPQALAQAIERLASDRALCMKFSEASRAAARQRHSPQTVREQLLQAYSTILLRSGKR